MHILYLNLTCDKRSSSPRAFWDNSQKQQEYFNALRKHCPLQISYLQRALFEDEKVHQQINYYFIKDRLPDRLRWWQEPIQLFDLVERLEADMIEIPGLDTPLQFRLLRRRIGPEVLLIGRHFGEDFWVNRKLWLQQFGLRVANAFIFTDPNIYQTWLRASVVLKKQKVLILSAANHYSEKDIQATCDFYRELCD